MAYDAARGKVLLFGGFDDAGNGETWEYDGPTQTWTQVPVASPDAPSPRNGHAMAYDAARGKVVLFGGQDDGGKSGETWEYDGATQTWTQVPVASPDAPSARNLHAMAYDAARGRVVLFGGINDGAIDGETWEYDSGTQSWARVQVASPDAPSPRSSAMAYDIARGKVVLFGGAAIGGLDAETWEYGGATQSWTQVPVASAGAPSPRDDHAMVYDAARGKVVLFGGRVGNPSRLNGETWEYDGATQTWNEVPVASPDAPSPRAGAMAYDAARGKIVLFGGSDATGVNGETWEYDGATESWTQVAVASPDAPSPRKGHAMTYDAARRRVVLFGGGDDETWEYDGPTQSWTQVAQAGSLPRPRRDHAMAYDAARGKVVLFGSISLGGGDTETWEYGATQSWTQVPVGAPNSPSLRFRHAMAYDAARGEVVLFGGDNGSGITNDESWTFQHTAGVADACTPGFDGDGDGLVGCDDPDCWGFCTPHCPVNSTPLWPTDCDTAQPHCGDGVCNPFLETPRLCPGDCGPPAPLCGDFHCDDFEDAASCPGDCTP
jgi:N-acetylneuraminic acid mutarotase